MVSTLRCRNPTRFFVVVFEYIAVESRFASAVEAAVSLPRSYIPGTTYMLTRRTLERQFFLRPSEKINQIVEFCLAVAAQRTGVLLHAMCFMSNHFHLVVTDVHGNVAEFMHWLDEFIAKCVNAELGRWETFWAPGSFSKVELTDEEALIHKLVYTYVNPVDAVLVPRREEWPGALSFPADMEGPGKEIARPTGFFRENGPVPETAVLQFTKPSGLTISLDDLEVRTQECEREIRLRVERAGKKFLGRRRVLKQSPFGRPGKPADRGQLNPQVAGRDKWRRIEALQRLKSFVSAYRQALKLFKEGQRDVLFPYGTYGMRVRFGVMCSGP